MQHKASIEPYFQNGRRCDCGSPIFDYRVLCGGCAQKGARAIWADPSDAKMLARRLRGELKLAQNRLMQRMLL